MAKDKAKHAQLSGRQRSLNSLDRRFGIRQPGQRLLIVCEGVETEPNYFEEVRRILRLSAVRVQVDGRGVAPKALVEDARRRQQREADPFDSIWCVFDVDGQAHTTSFREAVEMARKSKFELGVSNPAFEYWYLLHYRETDQPFNDAKELIGVLMQPGCMPGYAKNCDVFRMLPKHIDFYTVVARAEKLLASHPDKGQEFPNPSTTIFRLVRTLIDMAQA